jgi:hypothetical protein
MTQTQDPAADEVREKDERMKNQIYAGADESGKFGAELWSYETTPSGSTRPILRVSSKFAFPSAEDAANHLFNALKEDVRQNTEISLTA